MKPTNDKVFLDTNILVYAHTDIDIIKQSVSQKLVTNSFSFVSTQVLQELANTLNRKFKHQWKDVEAVLTDATKNNNLHINNPNTIIHSCHISSLYGFSYYDSLIISAALECGCSVLFSEDLNNGQIIKNQLKIVNPFL